MEYTLIILEFYLAPGNLTWIETRDFTSKQNDIVKLEQPVTGLPVGL